MAPVFYQTPNPVSYVRDFTIKNLVLKKHNYSVHLVNKHFLSTHYMLRNLPGVRDRTVGEKMEALAQTNNVS